MLPGGKERQLFYLIRELSSIYSIQLIILNKSIHFKGLYTLPIKMVTIDQNQKYAIRSIAKINKCLKEFKPDIMHHYDIVSQLISIPYILWYHPYVINGSIRYAGNLKKTILFRVLQKIAYKTADKIISNSKMGLGVEGFENSKNALVIHNGIDKYNINNSSGETPLVNKYIETPRKFNFVMVGRFYDLKDYVTYIRSAIILLKDKHDVGFYCIGDGPSLAKAKEEAGSYLDNGIYFLGQRNDVQDLLKYFDVGVLLNDTNGHAEGISNAIMEFMAAGLPVIATNAGGTPEIMQNEITGYLVPAFDENYVANRMAAFMDSPELKSNMGKNGKKRIENDFSILKMVEAYNSLYEDMMNDVR